MCKVKGIPFLGKVPLDTGIGESRRGRGIQFFWRRVESGSEVEGGVEISRRKLVTNLQL